MFPFFSLPFNFGQSNNASQSASNFARDSGTCNNTNPFNFYGFNPFASSFANQFGGNNEAEHQSANTCWSNQFTNPFGNNYYGSNQCWPNSCWPNPFTNPCWSNPFTNHFTNTQSPPFTHNPFSSPCQPAPSQSFAVPGQDPMMFNMFLFTMNVSQAITILQQAMVELTQKTAGKNFVPSVIGDMMKKFINISSKFWSNPYHFHGYSARLSKNLSAVYNQLRIIGHNVAEGKPMQCDNIPNSDSAFKDDKRFSSEEWSKSQMHNMIRISYKAVRDAIYDTLEAGCCSINPATGNNTQCQQQTTPCGLTACEMHLLKFCTTQILDALSPSNYVMSNPEILNKVKKTHGGCLRDGAMNFLEDVRNGNEYFRMSTVDQSAFTVGKTLAATPGKVVYQNEFMQLIQYDPSTKDVNSVPMLVTTAWINKYYILDLQPKNSMIKWLVDQGHTVFLVSWVNPDASYAQKTFEDYVCNGFLTALEQVKKITSQPKVNCVAYCLGGTLAAVAASYLKKIGKDDINSLTFFTTLIDFEKCGDIKLFINEGVIQQLEEEMKKVGYLDGDALFTTFCWIRARDMVWPYYVHNYMMGEKPGAFDILYWNADSTRMPYVMHSYYLRKMYLENALINGGIDICDTKIDLSIISVPVYILATEDDHIAPWRSVYKGTQVYSSKKKRFVLTQSGHTAGVVNHPSKEKYGHYVNDKYCECPYQWLKNAQLKPGSWWVDWQQWMNTEELCGHKIAARQIDVANSIENAPGTYVTKRY